jgi:hypothetical protein
MRQPCQLSVRELITELSQVQCAIRGARTPGPSPIGARGAAETAWEDLAVLAVREQQIVKELRRREGRSPGVPVAAPSSADPWEVLAGRAAADELGRAYPETSTRSG